jgi:hypothetical protein
MGPEGVVDGSLLPLTLSLLLLLLLAVWLTELCNELLISWSVIKSLSQNSKINAVPHGNGVVTVFDSFPTDLFLLPANI